MVSLHEHEKRILLALNGPMGQRELAKATGLNPDSVAHASLWLMSKGLVRISEKRKALLSLGKEGKEYLKEGLPERQALMAIGGGTTASELEKKLGKGKFRIAMAWLMRKRLARSENGKLTLTAEGRKVLTKKMPEEEALEAIAAGKGIAEKEAGVLKGRGDLIRVTEDVARVISITPKGKKLVAGGITAATGANQLTPEMLQDGSWREMEFRPYNVSAVVPSVYPGRRHFAKQAMEYVRKVWLEMGFQEMEGPIINTSFWNFDALFTPQEHPVRDMQDTFFLKQKGELPEGGIVDRVRAAHELGTEGSIGWGYSWDPEKARELVLRTHTTVLSAMAIAKLKKEELPAKLFSVGRCFRNEALDWSHLFEFNQVEGIVVGGGVNFKHLLGYLKQFFSKLGFEKARFRPAYFPYTEMSVEIDVLHPRGEWVELGGAGMFRPEVVVPLLGEDIPVLAWGPGFDRIIMDYYSIRDIRELYKNDVQQLRTMRQWMRG